MRRNAVVCTAWNIYIIKFAPVLVNIHRVRWFAMFVTREATRIRVHARILKFQTDFPSCSLSLKLKGRGGAKYVYPRDPRPLTVNFKK